MLSDFLTSQTRENKETHNNALYIEQASAVLILGIIGFSCSIIINPFRQVSDARLSD